MRQLKGKTKETSKQRKERRREFLGNKKHDFSIVIPLLVGICLLICVYVYVKTRPKSIEEY